MSLCVCKTSLIQLKLAVVILNFLYECQNADSVLKSSELGN